LASGGMSAVIQLAFTGKVDWAKAGIAFGVGAIPFGQVVKSLSPFAKDGLHHWLVSR